MRRQIELHASIERGLADVRAGRVIPVEDLMKEFGLPVKVLGMGRGPVQRTVNN